LISVFSGGRATPIVRSFKSGAEEVSVNLLTWDVVTWLSITMVALAIVIFVFLGFKVVALMSRDAEEHKNGKQ